MKKVPEKFKGCGIRIHCLKCRCEVTSTCQKSGSPIKQCAHKESHRYKLVVHIPKTQSKKATKILETDSFEEALVEQAAFKNLIKNRGKLPSIPTVENLPTEQTEPVFINQVISVTRYVPPEPANLAIQESTRVIQEIDIKYPLVDYITMYLDFIYGINVPTHLKRELSYDHKKEIERTVYRFTEALTEKGINIKGVCLLTIGQDEIGYFCDYILKVVKAKSYNKHCALMKAFINWCIDIKDCDMKNPFEKMTLRIAAKKDKVAITNEEFKKLLDSITPENGSAVLGNGKRINYYYPWLSVAYRVALESGSRGEEVATLNFNQITELMPGVWAFKILNLKVWRIETGGDSSQVEKYIKYIPITASFLKLLEELNWRSLIGVDRTLIPYPNTLKLSFVQDIISRAFTHFIKFASKRKIEYKDLRKTYVTHITMALGDKAEIFTGHSDKGVIQRNYLADSFIAGGLHNLKIYDESA